MWIKTEHGLINLTRIERVTVKHLDNGARVEAYSGCGDMYILKTYSDDAQAEEALNEIYIRLTMDDDVITMPEQV